MNSRKLFKGFLVLLSVIRDFIYRRIANIVDRIMLFFFIKGHLKRQDRKHFSHTLTNLRNAVLFPSPYFRRNIVINRNICVLMNKTGYRKSKSGVIYQNNNIRMPTQYEVATNFHRMQNGMQME